MKVLVCGSRDWAAAKGGAEYAERVRILQARLQALRDEPYSGVTTIIHGACSRLVDGRELAADTLADRAAWGLGFETERHPANWKVYGRMAGPIRNRAMLDRQPDLVIAFQRSGSRGTQDTIDEARRRGIPVEVHDGGTVAA